MLMSLVRSSSSLFAQKTSGLGGLGQGAPLSPSPLILFSRSRSKPKPLFSNSNQFSTYSTNPSMTCQSLVIVGPSGVGKGTLITKLMERYQSKLDLSVSHTSRIPRPGEVDGIQYYFRDKKILEEQIADGSFKFIEYAIVHGNLYGTSLDAVKSIHDKNKVCILDVDVEGLRQLKANKFPAKYIFILPPSLEELEKRLRCRGTETEEQITLRTRNAKEEVAFSREKDIFDHLLVNDNLDTAVNELCTLALGWFPLILKHEKVLEGS